MNVKSILCTGVLAFSSFFSHGAESVLDRGAHYIVVQKVTKDGETSITNNWTTLQTGVSYWSESEKKWEASSDQIEVVPGGARHVRGPIKVNFPATYLDAQNPLTLTLEDGSTLKLRTYGLAMTDRTTGDSVIFAQVKNVDGFLSQDGTTVTYEDAFTGVSASIRVKVGIGKIEHDIVLHEDVRAADLGMNAANCDLEVFHEFLEDRLYTTQVSSARRASGTPASDTHIVLPGARIGRGTAFLVGAQETVVHNGTNGIPVRKEIYTDEQTGKKFLIEGLPLSEAESHLRTLPRRQAQVDKEKLREQMGSGRAVASGTRRSPIVAAVAEESDASLRKVAGVTRSTRPEKRGFLIDYTTLVTAANIRLAGNTTYFLSSAVSISGTLTIEGGTVVKYSKMNSWLSVNGTVSCETSLYSPATFTAVDDHSIGEQISTNALSGLYGGWGLNVETGGPVTLAHLRFRNLSGGIYTWESPLDITDLQVLNSYGGVAPDVSSSPGIFLRNFLSYNTLYPVLFANSSNSVHGEHWTVNRASELASLDGSYPGCELILTNSLLIQITNTTSGITITTNRVYTESVSALTNVLAGFNYLHMDALRDLGVTDLSIEMKALLNKTTTYKPIELTSNFTLNTTLSPQIPFDSENAPDIGYHFAPIDFLFTSLDVSSGMTLTLTNGVRLAGYGPDLITLNGTAAIVATGKPDRLVVLVPYNAVQEQPVKYITNNFTFFNGHNLDLDFTAALSLAPNINNCFLVPQGGYNSTIRISNSQFNAVYAEIINEYGTGYSPEAYLHNNVFTRSTLWAAQGMDEGAPADFTSSFRNNLFYRSTFALSHYSSIYGSMDVYDNFFDNSTLSLTELDGDTLTSVSHNGYSGASATFGGTSNKVSITATYESGPLGRFYYATTGSITNLVNAGSDGADDLYAYPWMFGLYHYTTAKNQTKEGTTQVDIGFHYVATTGSTSTTPYDYDSDGVPDYLEDTNGDGGVDSGETDWQDNDDLGLRVYITQPKSNSIIP